MTPVLPSTCERALLERFLRAEAMALGSVRAAQAQIVPPHVRTFLQRHEREEQDHLRRFEAMLGTSAIEKPKPPRVPSQWWALAVHLYGYEALGLEFAKLLVSLRPDLAAILRDEEDHVGFFQRKMEKILAAGEELAEAARASARAWRRRLPLTLERYLGDESLRPYRDELRRVILGALERRFRKLGLFNGV